MTRQDPILWPVCRDLSAEANREVLMLMGAFCQIVWPGGEPDIYQRKSDLPVENNWPTQCYLKSGVCVFNHHARWAHEEYALKEIAGECAIKRCSVEWTGDECKVSPPWEIYTVGLIRPWHLPNWPAVNLMWEFHKAWITRPDNWRNRK